MEKKRCIRDSSKDFIFQLPEDLRHDILSRLTTKDAMKTSVLSRAWRYVWLSLPSLDLGNQFFRQTFRKIPVGELQGEGEGNVHKESEKSPEELYFMFVDRVLRRRSEVCEQNELSSKFLLRKFCLNVPNAAWDLANQCLYYVVTRFEVQALEIQNDDDFTRAADFSKLPSHIIQFSPSLKSLTLMCMEVDQESIDLLAANCPLISSLSFVFCNFSRVVKVALFRRLVHLVVVEVSLGAHRLKIDSPNLLCFDYFRCGLEGIGPEIDIGACKELRKLSLYDIRLTADSLSSVLPSFSNIHDLELEHCFCGDNLKITSRSLRRLRLSGLSNFVELYVDAPELTDFYYSPLKRTTSDVEVPVPVFTWNAFAPEMTKVCKYDWDVSLWDVKFMKFLSQLVQCSHSVVLAANIRFTLHTLRQYRKSNFPPFHDIKHLDFFYLNLPPLTCPAVFHEIVVPALWLFPNLVTMKVRQLKFNLNLKFKYREDVGGSQHCRYCKNKPTKCWRQRMEEVKIEVAKGPQMYGSRLGQLFKCARDAERIIVSC